MSEISSLIKFRGQLKASVTRFLNFVTKENVDVNEVHVRKEKIEGIWSEYERIQSAIEETEGVEMNEQDKYREEFEDMFFKAVGIAKKLTEPVVNKKEAQPYHGESHLTYEEFNTILTRVEACLNSRPLTEMSSDPSDLTYLTPAHFLIGESLMAVPERDESTMPANRLDRWRRIRQYSQILWKRWSHEYLNQLQVRKKWSVERGPTLGIGTIVLIRDENLKPLNWKLGRVLSLHHGEDGVTRTALVKTMTGEYNRAFHISSSPSWRAVLTHDIVR
ncbi:hypothetical protein AGLY_015891 [Aphis glycines]|uniref:DUF5641 domain-containing protein n=1 Tax=Aphis glycines TaxID=307491 RepID=A0A6G0SZ71_APHGL|nr:hypothetical protein AGLY_015891 [Aphis glycines]